MMQPRTWTPLLLLALLHTPLQAADHFWDAIPASPSTTRPQVVIDDYWNSQYRRVNREVAAAKDCQLVFFGDSITWSWSLGPATGKAIWEQQYGPWKPINMGNSGDITPVMLHRVTRGNLEFPPGQQPKVAVLLCGINNFGVVKSAGGKELWDLGMKCPPEDIASGQRAIAQVFRRRLPHTRIIMLALLPVADRAKWEKCKQVNAIQAAVMRDSGEVAFINLQDQLLLPDGTFNKALYSDGIHLNADGYRVWEKAIAAQIDQFMKAPPLEPVKIMLIGGSATEGPDSGRSYRCYLDGMLRRAGHKIDFVGSRHKHNDDKSEPDSYQFDVDHEGHWDKDAAWFAENMPRLLEQNVPDIAVIQVGSPDKKMAEGNVRDIGRVVDALRAKNPKVKIVIGNAGLAEGRQEAAALIKTKVPATEQSSVAVVDIGWEAMPQDPLPSAEDAKRIATTFAEAVGLFMPARKAGEGK